MAVPVDIAVKRPTKKRKIMSDSSEKSDSDAESSSSRSSTSSRGRLFISKRMWPLTPLPVLSKNFIAAVRDVLLEGKEEKALSKLDEFWESTLANMSDLLSSSPVKFATGTYKGRAQILVPQTHVFKLARLVRDQAEKNRSRIANTVREESWYIESSSAHEIQDVNLHDVSSYDQVVRKLHPDLIPHWLDAPNRQLATPSSSDDDFDTVSTPKTKALTTPAPTLPAPSVEQTVALVDTQRLSTDCLEFLRQVYHNQIQKSEHAAFMALDIEAWEKDHRIITEFGYSILSHSAQGEVESRQRRETQHVIVKEYSMLENLRFSPGARDHFAFGSSLVLPSQAVHALLSALFDTLSSTRPLFLIMHDARSDMKFLDTFGIDTSAFVSLHASNLPKAQSKTSNRKVDAAARPGIYVVDSQTLFAEHLQKRGRTKLASCAEHMNVDTTKITLHNAGNDAAITLMLFEALMKNVS